MNTSVTDTVLSVEDLGVDLLPTTGLPAGRVLLQGCSFQLHAGQRLTLVGESGAGKSLLAQAIMGTLPAAMRARGRVRIAGHDTHGHRDRTQPLWGRQVGMLPQEPWTALSPLMRLHTQVAEAGRHASRLPWSQAQARADQHLAALGLATAGRQWLHQVSGGMAQRVGIACASQGDTRILIADEPTKGLDTGACEQVTQLLTNAQQNGQALLTITHDLDLAERLGGQIAVLRAGQIVEQGPVGDVLNHPRHPYTQALMTAQPRHWPDLMPPHTTGETLITAEGISVTRGERLIFREADLHIGQGASVSVVGPSGCGKTTLGNVLVGILPPSRGRVSHRADVARWRFQKLYQDPVASFAAQQTLRQGLTDLIRLHRLDPGPVETWLQRLRLSDELLDRQPGEVSGGELQRLALLRAMLLNPVFVFADEPTSRLDALTQRDTLAALCDAMAESGCALLLVTHDPHIAQHATQVQWRIQAQTLVWRANGNDPTKERIRI